MAFMVFMAFMATFIALMACIVFLEPCMVFLLAGLAKGMAVKVLEQPMGVGFKALEAGNAETNVKKIHGHENMVTHSKPLGLSLGNIQSP